jgi:hypothetical protein
MDVKFGLSPDWRTCAEVLWEQGPKGAEKNIWVQGGGSDRSLKKIA